MKLTIVSGRSGSGKTIALRLLEDLGFYCVDNLPLNLFSNLIFNDSLISNNVAISIDARNVPKELGDFEKAIIEFKNQGNECNILYLDAEDNVLLNRFNETRRKHPLTNDSTSLREAINKELVLLQPIAKISDLTIDTSKLSTQQLCQIIRDTYRNSINCSLNVSIESFGYKHGNPVNADFIFDVRCLPNPFWEPELRHATGKDESVINFLAQKPEAKQIITDLQNFLESWLPRFEVDNRSYIHVAIGCTGGQHRSVYIAEQVAAVLKKKYNSIQIRHRDLA